MSSPSPKHFAYLSALACIIVGSTGTLWRYAPPAPQSADSEGFSAEAALDVLGRILIDDAPHPIGTLAQEDVRKRLVRELRAAGAEPQEGRDFICSPVGVCGWTNNIVVHLPGSRQSALMYSCHTDSAPVGPGASDDGAAVAIGVELVRHWVRTPHENSLIFLFDEGEEVGLLGALAFLEKDPLAPTVAAAINLEARGTSGISQLFETTPNSSWMVAAWAGHASMPFANSLSDLVYDTMPNLTDVTVWEWFGIPAANFAFTEGSQHYHTDLDTLENLDASAVQSHGDNAWAMFDALADRDLDHAPLGEQAYFDVLGLAVLRWPMAWTPWLALGGFALSLGAAWRNREHLGLGNVSGAGAAWIAAVVLGGGWAGGLAFSLQTLSGVRDPWAAHGLPLTVGMGLGTLALVCLIGSLTRSMREAVMLTVTVLTAAVGVVLGVFAPAAAYLFSVPATVAAALSLFNPERGAIGGLLTGVVLWFPVIYGLRVALGLEVSAALGGALVLSLSFAIPLVADLPSRLSALLLPVAAAIASITLALPHYSESVPERIFSREFVSNEPPPRLEALALGASEDGWKLTGRLRSIRGAPEALLSIDARAGISELRIEGSPVRDLHDDLLIVGLPPAGVRFEADLADPSIPWKVADRTRVHVDKPPLTTVSWDGFERWVVAEMAPIPMAEASP